MRDKRLVSTTSWILTVAMVACWVGRSQADVITFSGGTVTLLDDTTRTTNGSDHWIEVDYYEEDGFRLDFLPNSSGTVTTVGPHYGYGKDVAHAHWDSGVTTIEISKVGGGTFDLNYFLITSNTDNPAEPASGNEMAWVEGFVSNVSTGAPLLLPSEDWGFPASQVYLGTSFDAVDLVRFYVTNSVFCFGMDSFYVDESAPSPIGETANKAIRKHVRNDTVEPANGFQWLVEGDYTSVGVGHLETPPFFSNFERTLVAGNTLFRWEAVPGTSEVPPGGSAEFAFQAAGPAPHTLKAAWTLNGSVTGCVPQITVTDFSDFTSVMRVPDFIKFRNTVLDPPVCPGTELYVGGTSIEWLLTEAPLEDLNETANRFPIRTDAVPGTHVIPAGAELQLSIPSPPPSNARFALIKVSVADNPSLVDASIDYIQFGFLLPPPVPALSQWGTVILIALFVVIRAHLTSPRPTAKAN